MPVALPLPPADPGFEILLTSRGISQGIAQTDGVQLIPRVFVRIGEVQVGAQWRNISSPIANGVAAFFFKLSHKYRKGQIDGAIIYRVRTGVRNSAVGEAWEFDLGAAREFGRLAVRISAEYSPDEFGSGKSLYIEVGPTLKLDPATKVSASVGRKERDGGPDYTSANLGISRLVQRSLTLDARYYDTNRGKVSVRYQGRIVLSARLAL